MSKRKNFLTIESKIVQEPNHNWYIQNFYYKFSNSVFILHRKYRFNLFLPISYLSYISNISLREEKIYRIHVKSKKRIIQIYEEKTKRNLPTMNTSKCIDPLPSMTQIEIEFVRFCSNRFSDFDSVEFSFHNEACKVMEK